MTLLTLLDHHAQHSAQFQHDRCPTARVDGTVDPTVPVIPIDDIPVCGHKHTQSTSAEQLQSNCKLKTDDIVKI